MVPGRLSWILEHPHQILYQKRPQSSSLPICFTCTNDSTAQHTERDPRCRCVNWCDGFLTQVSCPLFCLRHWRVCCTHGPLQSKRVRLYQYGRWLCLWMPGRLHWRWSPLLWYGHVWGLCSVWKADAFLPLWFLPPCLKCGNLSNWSICKACSCQWISPLSVCTLFSGYRSRERKSDGEEGSGGEAVEIYWKSLPWI